MGRLSTAHKAAMGADVIRLGIFAEFEFDSATTRMWSGPDDIFWNGYTWLSGAGIAGMKTSGEGEGLEARRMEFILIDVAKTYYTIAVNTHFRDRACRVYWNLMNADFTAVAHAYLMEEARMNQPKIFEGEDTITIMLTAESNLLDMFRPNRVSMTSADHKKLHPNDDFYKFVPSLPGAQLPWGLEGARGSNWTTGPGDKPGVQQYRPR